MSTTATKPETQVPEDGVHLDVPTEDYVAWPLPSSGSPWKARRRTLKAVKQDIDTGADGDTSVARYLGDVVHCALLEPDEFESRYVCLPAYDPDRHTLADGGEATNWKATKAYKEDVAALTEEAEANGQKVVEVDQYQKAVAMRDQVFSHPEAKALLHAEGLVEASIIVTDPEFGVRWKLRPDKIVRKVGANLSVKTTRNAREDVFTHDFFKFGYHVKEAIYKMLLPHAGLDVRHAWMLAIESEGAKECALFEIDEAYLDMGQQLALKYMRKIADALHADEWPGIPSGLITLSAPEYAYNRVDEELLRP